MIASDKRPRKRLTEATVGAFWVLPGARVIGERCPLAQADRVGDCFDGRAGHEALWSELARPAAFIGRSYSTVPRGRILFRADESRFVVFAAPEIVSNPESRQAVETYFGLLVTNTRTDWQTDPHYVTQPYIADESDDGA
jgi:hypothetical protein